jgi:hypothetical protein
MLEAAEKSRQDAANSISHFMDSSAKVQVCLAENFYL